jgi:hypothetical protein
MAVINPKAAEISVSFKFFGPDEGVFPDTSSFTPITTRKLNRLRFESGDETADFKAGQQIISMERIIGASPRLVGSMNLEHPDAFLKKFRDEGPLVEVTVSTFNFSLSGSAQEERFKFRGIMMGPEIDFLHNPGTVLFEVNAYGSPLIYQASDEAKS